MAEKNTYFVHKNFDGVFANESQNIFQTGLSTVYIPGKLRIGTTNTSNDLYKFSVFNNASLAGHVNSFRVVHNVTSPYSVAQEIEINYINSHAFQVRNPNSGVRFNIAGDGSTWIKVKDEPLVAPQFEAFKPFKIFEDLGSSNSREMFVIERHGGIVINSYPRTPPVSSNEKYHLIRVHLDQVGDIFRVDKTGKVWCTELEVAPEGTFPDYVFDGDYQLPSIQELNEFIKKYKHLPNVPSAAEISEAGAINIGELQLQMLEKIEELTLYIVELNNRIEELESQL